jgi:hypothetical protein
MAYIGRDTDKISNVEVLDNITFDGSSSYTLQKNSVNFTPSSANTLLVSIDGVVQAGNFTVSGSTIDFGTAVAGTSTCDFILHYGVGLITTPADGTVTTAKLADSSVSLAKLTATGTKDATTFLRGDNTFQTIGTNTPAFRAYMGSSQTIADVTNAVVQYNTENFDTDSAYDTATYRFTVPSDKAGKYFFGAHLFLTDAGNSIYAADMQIRKNGVNASADNFAIDSADYYAAIFKTTTILDLAVGDYVDVNVLANTNDGTSWVAVNSSPYQFAVFYGFKLL